MANISANAILSYATVTVAGKEYTFQTSSIYKTKAISDATGIVSIPPEVFTGTEPLVKVEQLLRSGKLVRLSLLVANPIDGKKNKSVALLCDAELAILARTALPGKTLQIVKNGKTIVIGKIIKVRGKTTDRFF